MWCNKIADCLSKKLRFVHTQPFLNLYMFEKAHIVFRSQIIIDTMIVNRLKHRVLDRSCFIYQIFPCYNNQWKLWPTKCTPNKIYFRNIKYTRINSSATRRYRFILLHQAMFHLFHSKTGVSVLTLQLYIQKQIIYSLKHFHPSLICNAISV